MAGDTPLSVAVSVPRYRAVREPASCLALCLPIGMSDVYSELISIQLVSRIGLIMRVKYRLIVGGISNAVALICNTNAVLADVF